MLMFPVRSRPNLREGPPVRQEQIRNSPWRALGRHSRAECRRHAARHAGGAGRGAGRGGGGRWRQHGRNRGGRDRAGRAGGDGAARAGRADRRRRRRGAGRLAAAAARRHLPRPGVGGGGGGVHGARAGPGRLFPLCAGLARSPRPPAESLVAWRCRRLFLPYGDQGLLIARSLLDSVGGIGPLPLMEDVDLAHRLGGRRLAGLDGRRGHFGGAVGARRLVAAIGPQPGLPGALLRRRAATADRAALRMRDTVFVFARAPRLGTVKRRLAGEIGERAALRFHRATLARLLRALAADRRFAHRAGGHARSCPRRPPARRRGGAAGRRRPWRAHAPRARPGAPGRGGGLRHPRPGAADVAAAFRALGGATPASARPRMAATGWWRWARGARRGPSPAVRWSSRARAAPTRWRTSRGAGATCCDG